MMKRVVDGPHLRPVLGWLGRRSPGNVAMIFGISLIPLLIAAGTAVDMSRAVIVKSRLSKAIDAAGLAVGGSIGKTQQELEQIASDYFYANYPYDKLGQTTQFNVSVSDNIVSIDATAEVSTTLMKIAGMDKVEVHSSAEIIRETKKLEVALVLDNTGSMSSNGKIGALRTAATELINIIFGDNPSPDHLTVSLVPFVTAVNIKNEEFDWSWIDGAQGRDALAQFHGVNFLPMPDGSKVNHLDLFDNIANADWRGCVETRPAPYDTDDTEPSIANPDTLFVPYFWPDEPDTGGSDFHNKYATDKLASYPGGLADTEANRQANWAKYDGSNVTVDETPMDTAGPNKSCATPLVPLTRDKQRLLTEIANMQPWNNSGTNNAEGLAWGLRVLSPTPPFTTGAAWDDPETRKALIVLTDGENQIFGGYSQLNKSNYSSVGYLSLNRLGTTSYQTAKGKLNAKVIEVCDELKAQKVRIYAITFQVSAAAIKDTFLACASDPTLYFNSPSNADLQDVFRAIGQDLSNLRLSK
ncbi:MAG: hypothetical protein HXY25_07020 [Alphaproteobacteria bacterium]|nr:hypothetical protein [Alphaproteobacteria bacterium]